MKKIDYLTLNGNSLLIFMTVLNELSVSKAAERLCVTQSSVSHTIEKLRLALGDQLFVRSGRGIIATEQAIELSKPIQKILDSLKSLTYLKQFDPTSALLHFKIAANDFSRSFIFPTLSKNLAKQSINVSFEFLPAMIPNASSLRENYCDLIITPFPPDGSDLMQTTLFTDELNCFFDGNVISAPATQQEFINANHLDVTFENQKSVFQSLSSSTKELAELPSPKISVPNFDAISEFILETDLITVQMKKMSKTCLKDLNHASLPFKTPLIKLYMVWNSKDNNNPAHKWLRIQIKESIKMSDQFK